MWIKPFESLSAHAALVHLASMAKNKKIEADKAASFLRRAGTTGKDIAISCIAGLLDKAVHAREQSLRLIRLLRTDDIIKAVACVPTNDLVFKVSDALYANNIMQPADAAELLTIRCFLIKASKAEEAEGALLQEAFVQEMISHLSRTKRYQALFCILRTPLGSKELTFATFEKLFAQVEESSGEDFVAFLLLFPPSTIGKEVALFTKALQRIFKIERNGGNLPAKLFYTRILPAFHSFPCAKLMTKELSYIPYNVFHVFHAVEPNRIRRNIFHKVFETAPSFTLDESLTMPEEFGIFVKNPHYAFKTLFYLQTLDDDIAKGATGIMRQILSNHKQCRWIQEAFDSAFFTSMSRPSGAREVKGLGLTVQMLLKANLLDYSKMSHIIVSGLQRLQHTDIPAMLDVIRAYLSRAGVDRTGFEQFEHRSELLMGPMAFLFQTSTLPGRGKALRGSIIKFFLQIGFQAYFEVVYHLVRFYTECDTHRTEILGVLLGLLYLSEYTKKEFEAMNQPDPESSRCISNRGFQPDASVLMHSVYIPSEETAKHTLNNLRNLAQQRGDDDRLQWVVESFDRVFEPTESSQASLAASFQAFTVFSISWTDKPFTTNSRFNVDAYSEDHLDAETSAQKSRYEKHRTRVFQAEELEDFFKSRALTRIRCSNREALATFYFFLHHIPMSTYASLAVELIDTFTQCVVEGSDSVGFFIRCVLDELRRSDVPAARCDAIMQRLREKFTLLVLEHSFTAPAMLNVLQLTKELIEFLCSSDDSKTKIIQSIEKRAEGEPQAEIATLKAIFEKQAVFRFQAAPIMPKKAGQASRPGVKRERHDRSSDQSRMDSRSRSRMDHRSHHRH